jgi:hypothetical protein
MLVTFRQCEKLLLPFFKGRKGHRQTKRLQSDAAVKSNPIKENKREDETNKKMKTTVWRPPWKHRFGPNLKAIGTFSDGQVQRSIQHPPPISSGGERLSTGFVSFLLLLRFTEIIFIFHRRDPFPLDTSQMMEKQRLSGGWRMNALEIFPDESEQERKWWSPTTKKFVEDSDEEECQDAGYKSHQMNTQKCRPKCGIKVAGSVALCG